MTRDEFTEQYAAKSGMTKDEYLAECVTLPCSCPEEGCPSWAAVSKHPLSIKAHMELYAPKEARDGSA